MHEIRNNTWKVYVRCMTYNHASFIVAALQGFCIQETNFPYLCVIVDDASLDGEAKVIDNYLKDNFVLIDASDTIPVETDHYKMVFAQHKINKNCYFAVYYLKYNHYGKKDKEPYYYPLIKGCKYLANCEGDDYWTGKKKLQNQFEILEKNHQITLVHSAFDFVDEEGAITPTPDASMYTNIRGMNKEGHLWHSHIVIGTPILFCTTMCRIAALEKDQLTVDYEWFMSCARKGLISYIDAKTSAYRINSQSLMRTQHDAVNTRIKNAIFYQLYVFKQEV